jgi:SAM-dependent methyltransferase
VKWIMDRLLQRRAERLIRFILPELPPIGPILDVGSGTGHNADCLAGIAPLQVIEADVVDIHLVGRGPVLFDGKALPFPDAQFSASILLFVLQYAAEPELLLKETSRVTSGRVMVLQSIYSGRIGHSVLRAWDFLTGRLAFLVASAFGLISARTSALRPEQLFTRESLEQLLGKSGFRVLAVRRLDALAVHVSRELYVLEPPVPCP